MSRSVLVTGGAGYVGSAVCEGLLKAGHKVVVVDNLATGFTSLIAPGCFFYMGSYGDYNGISKIIKQESIDVVVHCAAKSLVQESMENPLSYYKANVSDSIELLRASIDLGVKEFIFSSSAATYGQPTSSPIDESFDLNPINPYGETKVAFERALASASRAYGLKSIAFRYFNVAGATEVSAERHADETHLIPRMLKAATSGMRFRVFGDDYDTEDGSAVRDYIHVADIATAHLRAIEYFSSSEAGKFHAVNIGSGIGTSVFQAAHEIGECIGKKVQIAVDSRRPGDPASLVANVSAAKELLGWEPENSSISQIVKSIT